MLGTTAGAPPRALVTGRWFDPAAGGQGAGGDEAVGGALSAGAAEALGAGVGMELIVSKFRWSTNTPGAPAPPPVRAVPGLAPDRTLPLAVEQARLARDVTGSAARTSVTRQDNVIVAGLDPDRGVGGENPVLNLMFVAGRRDDFGLARVNDFFADADGTRSTDEIDAALQAIGERHPGPPQPVNAQGRWEIAAANFGKTVRLCTPEIVRERILLNAEGMIWGMCVLPLVTLAVASLGALNAALASVRTRRWEMGVLRAVGLTRFALIRLVAAESPLVGSAACLRSLAFGRAAGWCGVGISQSVSFFGGMNPALVISRGPLALGFAATLTLCLLAALWPAVAAGRTEPLRLLREGRSAA